MHCTPLFRFDQTHLDSGWDLKHWNQTQGLNQLPGFPRREKTRSEVIGRWRCDTWLKKTRPTCICLIFQIGWGFPQNKDHPISFFIAAVNSHILTRGAGKYIRGGLYIRRFPPGHKFCCLSTGINVLPLHLDIYIDDKQSKSRICTWQTFYFSNLSFIWLAINRPNRADVIMIISSIRSVISVACKLN